MRGIYKQSKGENFGIFESQNFLFPFIVHLLTEDFCEASMKNCKFYTKQLKKNNLLQPYCSKTEDLPV